MAQRCREMRKSEVNYSSGDYWENKKKSQKTLYNYDDGINKTKKN